MKAEEAEKILKLNLEEWGEDRPNFHATLEEIRILLQGGAKIIHLNEDNKDGSFKTEVLFGGKYFIASTSEKKEF